MIRLFRRDGSGLVMVMMFAGGLGLILSSLVPLVVQELERSHERVLEVQAYHCAEAFMDMAIFELTTMDSAGDLLNNGWKKDSSGAFLVREYSVADLGWAFFPGDHMVSRVMMDDPASHTTIRIWSKAEQTRDGSSVEPQVVLLKAELEITSASTSIHFPAGMGTSEEGFDFNGHPFIDSYDSSVFPYTYTSGVNSGSNAVVATTATDESKIDLGNVTIKGTLLVGLPEDNVSTVGASGVSGGVRGDYSFDFPLPATPSTAGAKTTFP